MREDIKERIEKIKRGEVPEGYKKTKAGIVPITWSKQTFNSLFKEKKIMTNELKKYPLYSLTLENGVVEKSDRYDREHLVKKDDDIYKIVEKNDFAYNPMNIRFGAVARNKTDRAVCVSGYYDIFEVVNREDLDYMDNYLISGPMINYYNKMCTGSLDEKKRVHFSVFLEFTLPLPDIQERKRISEILCVFEKKKILQEKLIREKIKQKNYLRKKMLNGSMKISGFNTKWRQVRLKDIALKCIEKNTEFVYTEVFSNSAQHGVVLQEEQFNKEIANVKNIDSYYVIKQNEFVYNPRISNTAPCGPINMNDTGRTGVMSPLYTIFKLTDRTVNFEYLRHYFLTDIWHNYIKEVANYGARHDRMNISNNDFFLMPIILPSEAEQSKMVDILKNADKEIELLQQQLEQIKLEKKAMMQLLLTGIIRVNQKGGE